MRDRGGEAQDVAGVEGGGHQAPLSARLRRDRQSSCRRAVLEHDSLASPSSARIRSASAKSRRLLRPPFGARREAEPRSALGRQAGRPVERHAQIFRRVLAEQPEQADRADLQASAGSSIADRRANAERRVEIVGQRRQHAVVDAQHASRLASPRHADRGGPASPCSARPAPPTIPAAGGNGPRARRSAAPRPCGPPPSSSPTVTTLPRLFDIFSLPAMERKPLWTQ